jgi:hypothetical protein
MQFAVTEEKQSSVKCSCTLQEKNLNNSNKKRETAKLHYHHQQSKGYILHTPGAQIHYSDNTWVCMHFFHQEGTLSVSAGI